MPEQEAAKLAAREKIRHADVLRVRGAIDDCGNRFCLSIESPDFGSVYFWDHEEEEGEEPTELNLYHVADSFAEFWNRMEPIDPDEYLAETDSPIDAESQRPSSDVPPPPTDGAPSGADDRSPHCRRETRRSAISNWTPPIIGLIAVIK
jgi:hypothetical protein